MVIISTIEKKQQVSRKFYNKMKSFYFIRYNNNIRHLSVLSEKYFKVFLKYITNWNKSNITFELLSLRSIG